MNNFMTIFSENLKLLARDKLFYIGLITSIVIVFAANIMSDWGTEEYYKYLFDFSSFGIILTGLAFSILWTSQLFSNSGTFGYLDIPLSSGFTRLQMVLGKYFALAVFLMIYGLINIVFLQISMLINEFGWLSLDQLIILVVLFFSWMVVQAMATFIASLASQNVTIIATIVITFIGLISRFIADSISLFEDESGKAVIHAISQIWDLQRFNFSMHFGENYPVPFDSAEASMQVMIGLVSIAALLSMSIFRFNRKDLV